MQNTDATTVVTIVIFAALALLLIAALNYRYTRTQKSQKQRRKDNLPGWYEDELERLFDAQFQMKMSAMETAKEIMRLRMRR